MRGVWACDHERVELGKTAWHSSGSSPGPRLLTRVLAANHALLRRPWDHKTSDIIPEHQPETKASNRQRSSVGLKRAAALSHLEEGNVQDCAERLGNTRRHSIPPIQPSSRIIGSQPPRPGSLHFTCILRGGERAKSGKDARSPIEQS